MNHLRIIIFCLSLTSFASAEGFRIAGPFATSDNAILNQDTLQAGASFYVHHGSATTMESGSLTVGGENVIDKINTIGIDTGTLSATQVIMGASTESLRAVQAVMGASTETNAGNITTNASDIDGVGQATGTLRTDLYSTQQATGTLRTTQLTIQVATGTLRTDAALLIATQTLTGQNTFNAQTTISSGMTISGNVGIGLTNPVSKFNVHNGTITISTTTGDFGIQYQDNSFQNTAHNPTAISSEPAHNPDVAFLTYVGVATVTYVNKYARFVRCGYTLSIETAGASKTFTVVIAIDGVIDPDHEHPQENSGNAHSLHTDTHYTTMSAGQHDCSVWVKTDNVTGTQEAINPHVDVIRH